MAGLSIEPAEISALAGACASFQATKRSALVRGDCSDMHRLAQTGKVGRRWGEGNGQVYSRVANPRQDDVRIRA